MKIGLTIDWDIFKGGGRKKLKKNRIFQKS